jgi:hypothetical protein
MRTALPICGLTVSGGRKAYVREASSRRKNIPTLAGAIGIPWYVQLCRAFVPIFSLMPNLTQRKKSWRNLNSPLMNNL